MNRRIDWIIVIVALLFAFGCSGGGCGGCLKLEPIPGGFNPQKRVANAGQLRVTQTGLANVSKDPGAILGSIAGGSGGVLSFNVPSSCGGSTPIMQPFRSRKPTCDESAWTS